MMIAATKYSINSGKKLKFGPLDIINGIMGVGMNTEYRKLFGGATLLKTT